MGHVWAPTCFKVLGCALSFLGALFLSSVTLLQFVAYFAFPILAFFAFLTVAMICSACKSQKVALLWIFFIGHCCG